MAKKEDSPCEIQQSWNSEAIISQDESVDNGWPGYEEPRVVKIHYISSIS